MVTRAGAGPSRRSASRAYRFRGTRASAWCRHPFCVSVLIALGNARDAARSCRCGCRAFARSESSSGTLRRRPFRPGAASRVFRRSISSSRIAPVVSSLGAVLSDAASRCIQKFLIFRTLLAEWSSGDRPLSPKCGAGIVRGLRPAACGNLPCLPVRSVERPLCGLRRASGGHERQA